MKSTPKWLMIPPVVAALLILGPLSMQNDGGADQADRTTTTNTTTNTAPKASGQQAGGELPGSLVPKTPDMWRIGTTLVGVLLLGGVGIVVLRKLRGGATPQGGNKLATLRQTVRLSQKQALHAIEFEDHILLVGESDKGLTLIERGRVPVSSADEHEVLARHVDATVEDDDADEGATPKNLVIPRPEKAPARAAAAPRPASPQKVAAATAQLNDFRNLLMKAGR